MTTLRKNKVSLHQDICRSENLEAAYAAEFGKKPPPGEDGQTPIAFSKKRTQNIAALQNELQRLNYRPRPVLTVFPEKASKPVALLAFRDRVAQRAILNVLQPVWEAGFAPESYAFRPGRSIQTAQKRALELAQSHPFVQIMDIESFFESIPLNRLTTKIFAALPCPVTARLVTQASRHGRHHKKGLIRGAILAPVLSNLYLTRFDHAMAKHIHFVRYCDDIAIFSATVGLAEKHFKQARKGLRQEGLRLNLQKIQSTTFAQGFVFLGTFFRKV